MKCDVCGDELHFRWTDTHGIGVCVTCGCPYKILHYDDGTGQQVGRPPELCLRPTGLDLAKRYWGEHKRMVVPGFYDVLGTSRRDGTTYSGATLEDLKMWRKWIKTQ